MVETPHVSVLLAVHNGAAHLEAAMRSMMAQTLRDIEIVVVDDASTDATPAILARLAAEDPRIRIETLEQNVRLPGALNRGLSVARAALIARMDADDISHPDRLALQKAYMDAHPRVAGLGTSLRRIRADGSVIRTSRRGRGPAECRWLIRFRLPITHPTTMFRRLPVDRPIEYDPAYPVTEDHDFFIRLLDHGDLACLPKVLFDYRQHAGNVTKHRWAEQLADAGRICRAFMRRELPDAVVHALTPTVDAFFGKRGVPADAILGGFRTMLAHDLAQMPRERRFLRRQTAQLAFETLRRTGLSKQEAIYAFAVHGRDMLLPLALRLAEIRGAA